MNRKEYEQARTDVFSTIAGESPDPRPAISLVAQQRMRFAAATVLAPAAAALAISGGPLAIGAALGVVIPHALITQSMRAGSMPTRDILRLSFTHNVAKTVAGAFGKSFEAQPDDLDLASRWAQVHPEVAAACQRWTEARSTKTLTAPEVDALRVAVTGSAALLNDYAESHMQELYAINEPVDQSSSLDPEEKSTRFKNALIGRRADHLACAVKPAPQSRNRTLGGN